MSIVGSYNLDMRSTYQDTELMLAVDCLQLNAPDPPGSGPG